MKKKNNNKTFQYMKLIITFDFKKLNFMQQEYEKIIIQ